MRSFQNDTFCGSYAPNEASSPHAIEKNVSLVFLFFPSITLPEGYRMYNMSDCGELQQLFCEVTRGDV